MESYTMIKTIKPKPQRTGAATYMEKTWVSKSAKGQPPADLGAWADTCLLEATACWVDS